MKIGPLSKVRSWLLIFGQEPEVFPCPVGVWGVEIVGVSDEVDVYWNTLNGSGGLHSVVLS